MEEVATATDQSNNNKAGDNDEAQDTVTSRSRDARRKAETPRHSAAPRRVPDTSSAALGAGAGGRTRPLRGPRC